MSLKQSTGLRNYMLLTGSLKTAMDLGYINIYAGNVPATADAALDGTNTVLCKITNASSATGLTFANTDSGGSIAKNSSEVWSGINAATGTATFYRHVAVGDDGTLSTTQSRLQGTGRNVRWRA